jgi:hypothetical protein
MSEALEAARALAGWGRDHRELLVVAGLGLTVLLLAWAVRRAVRSGRPDKWLATLSFLVGFGWSGEAMWEVATQKLHLSPVFVGFAFFLFESQMATAMLRAERHHKQHRHPGKHGRAVWLIAVVAGVIAAMAGDSPVEVGLRLAVPLLVAHQWWVGLTEDAERPADAITWTWTPRRVLVALGLAKPGEHDLKAVDRERHIRAIATVSHRLHSTAWAWRRNWMQTRLRRLAMNADDEMLDAARLRVERVWQAADRTRPIDAADRTLAAAAHAEAETARAEAEAARTAQADAVARAEAAAAKAEAEATRRTGVEAEVETLRAQMDAEATDRVKAQAEAEAARAEARTEALRVARVQGQADAAAQQWRQRVNDAQTAAAQAAQALSDEQRRRNTAEADARRQAQAYATAVGELDELRERVTRAETRAPRRSRRAPQPAREPLTFDGAPVPEVPGVGVSTVLAVLQARKTYPDETQKQLAERVEVSDRTVRSVLAAAPDRDFAVAAT